MTELYPFTFKPILKERIWGGRLLQADYGKALPPGPIGESWEITDRTEGVSVIENGTLAGRDLRWLVENHAADLLGKSQASSGRFPLLLKIIDAKEKLSLQVHPSIEAARQFGGELKTELWYVAQALPGSLLYAGVNRGVTQPSFEAAIRDGTVAKCFHQVSVRSGDALFLPSGRMHAIGDGIVIFEIQQNSDTTYRVFDWNRVDANGRPRDLHIAQSLLSIDFNDFEPALVAPEFTGEGVRSRTLASSPPFEAREWQIEPRQETSLQFDRALVLAVVDGQIELRAGNTSLTLRSGKFCLVPASCERAAVSTRGGACLLTTTAA